jgi:hypothetical protein
MTVKASGKIDDMNIIRNGKLHHPIESSYASAKTYCHPGTHFNAFITTSGMDVK